MPPAARRSMLFASLGGFVLCSSLYSFLYVSSPGFRAAFSATRSTPIISTAATTPTEISKENEHESYVFEEPACTPQQGFYQKANYCSIFLGRHNLKPFFTLVRFHMPDAKLLVDIGANKGLLSSRWLELWRPELNQSAIAHVDFVKQYVKVHAPEGTKLTWCGVTGMCDKPNLQERAFLDQYAPVTSHNRNNAEPFEIYSFEPSPHLYQMQQQYMSTRASDALRAVWKWFPHAASDVIKEVYFDAKWNEGSKIDPGKRGGVTNTTTRTVTLDSLAHYPHPHHPHANVNNNGSVSDIKVNTNPNLFGNRTIDVLKIDAEGVDAAVLVGASQLLRDERIRVVMWETPNAFPLHFPDWFGGVAKDFGELMDRLDKYASMTCYFPGRDSKMIKLTKCWHGYLSTAPRCNNMPILQSNAICVSRNMASSLYRTLEAKALIHQAL